MITKFFGQFLLEKSIINKQQLLAALDTQRAQSPLLGELAVEMNLLTAAQAQSINTAQMKEDKRFGDLAVEKKLLSEAQVEELLANQRKNRPYIGQVLVQLNYLTEQQVEHYLEEHGRDRNTQTEQINQEISACFNPALVHRVIDVFPKIYQRVCKRSLALDRTEINTTNNQATHTHVWQQQIALKKQKASAIRISLSTSQNNAIQIGTAFMNMPLSSFDELTIDAVNEFLNTFMGHVYFLAEENVESSSVSPPVFSPEAQTGAQQSVNLFFDGGDCSCVLMLELA